MNELSSTVETQQKSSTLMSELSSRPLGVYINNELSSRPLQSRLDLESLLDVSPIN